MGPVFVSQIINVIISSARINFSKISFAKHSKSLGLDCVLLAVGVQILQSRWSGKCALSNPCSALSLAMVGDMELWSFGPTRALLLVMPYTNNLMGNHEIPSFSSANCTSQLGATCKPAGNALDITVSLIRTSRSPEGHHPSPASAWTDTLSTAPAAPIQPMCKMLRK